jgi:hypothetical protein
LGIYDDLLNDIDGKKIIEEKIIEKEKIINTSPFNINSFINELSEIDKSHLLENLASDYITGYSIAADCIMYTIKRLLKTPIEDARSAWLPVLMRGILGTAVHDFIQSNTKQFTETERSLKVPSIKVSCRLDALIGSNILVEIKSCTYEDYAKIIKNQQSRESDWIQAITYKYLIENYLEEIKNPGVPLRTEPPQLNKYNIDYIQFIYVAHDICSSKIENMSDAIKSVKTIRQKLESKKNPFCFISVLDFNLKEIDITEYIYYIKEKIMAINNYINNNKLPSKEDKFVDESKCYFCIYKNFCEIKKI